LTHRPHSHGFLHLQDWLPWPVNASKGPQTPHSKITLGSLPVFTMTSRDMKGGNSELAVSMGSQFTLNEAEAAVGRQAGDAWVP
jgi:hypothetical protein